MFCGDKNFKENKWKHIRNERNWKQNLLQKTCKKKRYFSCLYRSKLYKEISKYAK